MSEEIDEAMAPRYWFNIKTGQVEKGKQSLWNQLLGPYDTAEEAARALDTARRRSDAWDEDDQEWRGTAGDRDDA